VLLVEDHSPTRLALERLLQRRNYMVFPAETAAEALAIASSEKIDIVISDIGLPDASGFELMAELEKRFGLKGIALTGYGTESDIARSRATGFAVHLIKPVSMQALDSAIASLTQAMVQA
jgi:DNA-binding response OmpR family regulator